MLESIKQITFGPANGALTGAILCCIFALVSHYINIVKSDEYSGKLFIVDGLIVLGGLQGALFGAVAGSIGGLLSMVLITPVALSIYGAFLVLAAWCVIRTSPRDRISNKPRSIGHKVIYRRHGTKRP